MNLLEKLQAANLQMPGDKLQLLRLYQNSSPSVKENPLVLPLNVILLNFAENGKDKGIQ